MPVVFGFGILGANAVVFEVILCEIIGCTTRHETIWIESSWILPKIRVHVKGVEVVHDLCVLWHVVATHFDVVCSVVRDAEWCKVLGYRGHE